MHLEYAPQWQVALQDLSDEELARVERCMTRQTFRAKSLLYEDGVSDPRICVVATGRVRTFYIDANGREFTTRVSGSGSLLGIIASLSEIPPETSVQALDDVLVMSIGKCEFDVLLHEISRLSANLNRLLAEMYREQLVRRKRTSHSAPVRLGKALYFLSNLQDGRRDWRPGEIRGLTQQDLANIVGTSRTWVSVMLGEFERSGAIQRAHGCIRIVDVAALELRISQLEEDVPRSMRERE